MVDVYVTALYLLYCIMYATNFTPSAIIHDPRSAYLIALQLILVSALRHQRTVIA